MKAHIGESYHMATEKAQPQELTASRIASAVSVGLAVFKLAAGLATGSLSLLASAIDSIFDAFTSFMGYMLLKMSLEPADREHPYGHSRIESLASFGQGAILVGISIFLAYGASQRFDHRHEPQMFNSTILVPALASVATFILWLYMGRVVKSTGSTVIAGDRLHYLSDLAGNILLVIGFTVSRIWHLFNIDAILTVVLSVFMFLGAIKITAEAIQGLVDYSDLNAEEDVEAVIKDFYPEALGVHKIRSRRSGRRLAMDIELLSCRLLKFQDVHDISHKVHTKILERRPELDLVIHSEPCHVQQCRTDGECAYRRFAKEK